MEGITKNAEVVRDAAEVPAGPPSYEEVLAMIDQRIAALRIYVVESDITRAQDAVRAVVNEASF